MLEAGDDVNPSEGGWSSERPRILISGDDAPTRVRLRVALRRWASCAEAAAGEATVAAAAGSRPDACLLDLGSADRGLRIVRELVACSPATAVVALTGRPADDEFLVVMRAGASGYLPRELDPARLRHVVRSVLRGEAAVPRQYVSRLVEEVRGGGGPQRRPALAPGQTVELTAREWEAVELLRQGLASREIAARLGISQVTVRRHLGAAYGKLGVGSRAGALRLLGGAGSAPA